MSFNPALPISFGDCADCTPCECVDIPCYKIYQVSGNSDGYEEDAHDTSVILSACETAFATDPDWSLIGCGEAGTRAFYCTESCLGDSTAPTETALTVGPSGEDVMALYSPIETTTNAFKWNKIRMRVFGPCDGFCIHYLEGGSLTVESGEIVQTGGTPTTQYYAAIADGAYLDIYPPTDLCSFDESPPYSYAVTCGPCPGDTTVSDGDP